MGQKAESRKQKAESRKQKAESRKQKAESRKQKAESRKQKAESRKQKAESRKQKAESRFLAARADAFARANAEEKASACPVRNSWIVGRQRAGHAPSLRDIYPKARARNADASGNFATSSRGCRGRRRGSSPTGR